MPETGRPIRAACVQMRSGIDRQANLKAATRLIEEAAGGGARLVLTPEMTNVVDRDKARLEANLPRWDDLEEIGTFAELARTHDLTLIIGSVAVTASEPGADWKMANRSVAFGPNGLIGTYDKIHLFDVDLPSGESWRESARMVAGEEAVVAGTPAGPIGLSVCYDVRFPWLYRELARAGAEILTVPAAFTVPTGEAHWESLLRARAIETGSYLLAAAQGGSHEDGRKTYGHSMIVDPWGRILTEKDDDEPGVVFADLDLGSVADTRTRIPNLQLERQRNVRISRA